MKLRCDGKDYEGNPAGAKRLEDGAWLVNGKRVRVARTAAGIEAWCGGHVWRLEAAEDGARRKAGKGHEGIVSPMTGKVRQVLAKAGDRVDAGAVLVVVEAMKMEYRVTAPHAGVLTKVSAVAGALVEMGQVLAELDETT
ncbi:MAG: 3-methylcrotonyl-CoA carboxylase alpha [Planctomycetota bacterium]|nr:MAG: 3-methylcrotonyl-CoA carboxylase alpha [Planctomycetota bacterium]